MQGFIDEQYYVYCATREEVLGFYALCKEYRLHFTKRWPALENLLIDLSNATFAYNYDRPYLDNDGVSYWEQSCIGDEERPVIPFRHLSCNTPEASDILDFL